MQKIICIVGPTGVGKTNLALEMAKRIGGSLVSADSVQVYKRLDIVSGKDIPKTSKFVPLPQLSNNGFNTGYYIYNDICIFLLDVVEPTHSFSASDFHLLAAKSIDYIASCGRIPIIVGGTGLYINALLNGLDKVVEPDFELRNKLSGLDVTMLQKMIPSGELARLNDSDRSNKRRVIHLIERLKSKKKAKSLKSNYDTFVIGLECDRGKLKERIDKRVDQRLRQGALGEAESLYKTYESLTSQVKDANGYKQLFQFLKHESSYEEALYRWKISEYRHAKNQMTWFRKYGNAIWIDIEKKGFEDEVEKSLTKFLL